MSTPEKETDELFVKQTEEAPEKKKSTAKPKKQNCCARLLQKLFFKLWPSEKKELYTTQGLWLRKMAAVSMFLDFCFFVFALAIVGFVPMIIDLFMGIWGYSVYLTVREWVVVLYCIFKCVFAFSMLFGDIGSANYRNSQQMQSTQLFGLIFNAGFHILSAYYVGRAYYYFRKNGGIWGTAGPEGVSDNKYVKAGIIAATTAADAVETKLDKDTEELKKTEEEQAEILKQLKEHEEK